MFDKILQTAHETGAEVLVQIKGYCCEQYKGRVFELDADYFSLFHNGPGGGIHWVFQRTDIAFLGLVVELPDPDQPYPKTSDTPSESLKTREGE